ncbi:MaoC family dehydratase [Sneathiella marina]|uniref:MaoC family dehydratase n=1 Tax=Sneathiella marina TaxID=2950108 RepID=A0ABY4W586_9PROT|nr:MaoC family dehydratase [Sneathiella marina]USG62355.1 MaoC family dehydratase [Sneathiella marina]
MSTIYFEDIGVGDKTVFGEKKVTLEEILKFARKYDPQPFHVDEKAANDSIYGGLIASGWHTGGMLMRMMVDNMVNQRAGLGSPGFDDLRWILPVRPGDVLRFESTVIETRRSTSRPEMGVIRAQIFLFNQNDEKVLSVKTIGMMKTRSA